MTTIIVILLVAAVAAVAVYTIYLAHRHETLTHILLKDGRVIVDEKTRETDRMLLVGLEKQGVVQFHSSIGVMDEYQKGVFLLTKNGRAFITGEVN